MGSKAPTFLSSYLPYLLRQADQALSAPLYEVLNRHGIARSEWRVLAVLNEFGELGVVELAQHSLSPQPTVTHAVGRLKERGLVERTRGVQDKRQRLVVLTPAGTKVTRSLIKQAEELERTALAHAGDRSTLFAQLRELTSLVEASNRNEAEIATEADVFAQLPKSRRSST